MRDMETEIEQSIRVNDAIRIMIAVTAFILFAFMITQSAIMQTSKIEEGTIVQRNDSVTTVVIPDLR